MNGVSSGFALTPVSLIASSAWFYSRLTEALKLVYIFEQFCLQLLVLGRHERLTPGAVAHALGPCLPPLVVIYCEILTTTRPPTSFASC